MIPLIKIEGLKKIYNEGEGDNEVRAVTKAGGDTIWITVPHGSRTEASVCPQGMRTGKRMALAPSQSALAKAACTSSVVRVISNPEGVSGLHAEQTPVHGLPRLLKWK